MDLRLLVQLHVLHMGHNAQLFELDFGQIGGIQN